MKEDSQANSQLQILLTFHADIVITLVNKFFLSSKCQLKLREYRHFFPSTHLLKLMLFGRLRKQFSVSYARQGDNLQTPPRYGPVEQNTQHKAAVDVHQQDLILSQCRVPYNPAELKSLLYSQICCSTAHCGRSDRGAQLGKENGKNMLMYFHYYKVGGHP